jgi:translation initiation factor 3 subunit I
LAHGEALRLRERSVAVGSMSWRAESTFVASSKLTDEEKEYLKLAKKLREILKLEERVAKGEVLEGLQSEKVAGKDKLLKEVVSWAMKLPPKTEVLEKNPDITALLPDSAVSKIEKTRRQEQQVRERKAEREEKEKDKPIFMCRHEKPITDVALAADGRHLFTCSKDRYVLCWSTKNKLLQVISTLGGHKGACFALDVTAGPYGVVSGDSTGWMHFWQADTSKLAVGSVTAPSASFEHRGMVRVLRWCPFDEPGGSRRLASTSDKLVSQPPAIRVWQVGGRGRVEEIIGVDDPEVLKGKANDLRWGGGGFLKLFTSHDNGYVAVWRADGTGPKREGSNVVQMPFLKAIKLHSGPIVSLAVSNDGSTLVTASHDKTSKAVDVTQQSTPVVVEYKAERMLRTVCLSQDFKAGPGGAGCVVIAGGEHDRDVTRSGATAAEFQAQVLQAETGDELVSVKAHFGPIHTLLPLPAFGKAGAFASVAEDGLLKVHGLDGRILHSDQLE